MKELIFNLVNGVRSRIPICCNLFFSYKLLVDPDYWVAAEEHKKRTGKEFDMFADKIDGESDYVQCDYCYAKNKVKEIRSNGTILLWLMRSD